MRRALFLVLLAVAAGSLGCGLFAPRPLWDQPPPPVKDEPVVDPAELHRTTLANGLQVMVLEDHRLPRFGIGVVVKRGAAIEGRGEAGVADYTAELMERGAGSRGALQLAAAVDDLGASLSVSADWDSFRVRVSGLSRDLEPLLGVLSDVVLRPRFDRAEARKVRSEQLARLARDAEDPDVQASWKLARVLYPDHRYGLPVEGTRPSVGRLDAAAARAFYRRVFTPKGAIFYAWGDVDSGALVDAVRKRFGGWRGGPLPPPAPAPAAPQVRHVVVVDRPDLNQAKIRFGGEGIARDAPDRIPVQLMNTVLGSGGFSSRLMARIRAQEGLTYGIYSYFLERREPGPFVVSTFTRVPQVGKLVHDTLQVLDGMRSHPPSAKELADAQTLRVGRFDLALETSQAVMGALVDLDVYGLPGDSLDTYRARIRAVTTRQAAVAAGRYVRPERLSIVAVGPAKSLVPALAPFGKVQVVKP